LEDRFLKSHRQADRWKDARANQTKERAEQWFYCSSNPVQSNQSSI